MAISFDQVGANTMAVLAQEGLGNLMQVNHKEPSF